MSRSDVRTTTTARGRDDGIRLDAVGQQFDGTTIFSELSLRIDSGETLAIIGPSGAGKTTLLRILALFQRPTAGTVRLDGTDIWALANGERLAARRRVGVVFQEPNLFDATVRRNVEYGLHIRRSWRDRLRHGLARYLSDEANDAVVEALDAVGLADAADRSVGSLSGGEAQRVAFARALAYEPAYLLLDEPTSDLDPRNTAVIEAAIAAARDRQIGVAIATHDMNQARRVADRTAVLLDGSIIETGPTGRVFENPDDPRARKFIDGELVY
ncbi:amino acid ABC transporter ATP-binding protein [Haloferacaceae archaeon DSL9]